MPRSRTAPAVQRTDIQREAEVRAAATAPAPPAAAPTPPAPTHYRQVIEGFRPGPVIGDVFTVRPSADGVRYRVTGPGPARFELRGIARPGADWRSESVPLAVWELSQGGNAEGLYRRPKPPVPEIAVQSDDGMREVRVTTGSVAPRFPVAVRVFVYPMTRKPSYRAEIELEMVGSE